MRSFARHWLGLLALVGALLLPGAGAAVDASPASAPTRPGGAATQIFLPLISKSTAHLLLAEYSVNGSPYAIAVESPTRAWFTLPDKSALGALTVSATSSQMLYFLTPTAGAGPYGIAYAAGAVWLSERAANRIARFDVATGAWEEFPLPTPNAGPTGIAVLPGDPNTVWFAERDANRLGRLTYAGPGSTTVDEFPLPWAGAQPEDVVIQNDGRIWFTAPGANRIGRFSPGLWPSALAWASVWTGSGSRPWAIVVDSAGYPWFTERAGNRVGQFFPQTIADIRWYGLPVAGSDPYDLALAGGRLWLTERAGDHVAQLVPQPTAFYRTPLPGGAPTGIAVDSTGCAWIAAGGTQRIARWCPPYLRSVYLPMAVRGR